MQCSKATPVNVVFQPTFPGLYSSLPRGTVALFSTPMLAVYISGGIIGTRVPEDILHTFRVFVPPTEAFTISN